MALCIARETARPLSRRTPIAWPLWVEAALVAAAIACLLPLFDRIAGDEAGRDRRFADGAIAVSGLPEPVLPSLCAAYAAHAEPLVRDRFCRSGDAVSNGAVDRIPTVLADARARIRSAFIAPIDEAQARLAELRIQQREGLGDLLTIGHSIEAIERELAPFIKRYALDTPGVTGPLPIACAFENIDANLARQSARADSQRDIANSNAVLLLGAALDGHPATGVVADVAILPTTATAERGACAGVLLTDALAQTASLVADARNAPQTVAKNDAMRALLRFAGWQWAGFMLAGFALLQLSRRAIRPAYGVALSLAVWAAAAWIGRVPWPLGSDRTFSIAREGESWLAPPAPFVAALIAAALIVGAYALLRHASAATPQSPASRVGYPGLVLFTGVGWLVLLDLSANGYIGNRYLALYHHGHLWLGMLIFCMLIFLRQPLGRALAWWLSLVDGVSNAITRKLGGTVAVTAFVVFVVALVGVVGVLLANMRQLTSELGRIWLIVGAAWFFFMRGTPLAERMARSGHSIVSLARYIAPLLFVVLVLIGAMFATRDMGPLLIAGYAAGAFIAASAAMWWHERRGSLRPAFAIATILFVAWILGLTAALFELGSVDDVTAARLENLAAPLASANDQLALVTWFQHAAPAEGFGLGNVPWCGYSSARGCAGVPAQIQSDYTFTALVGAFGMPLAWAITIGCAVWLHRLIRHHSRVTRGEPRFVVANGRVSTDAQAFLSWLSVTWVVLALCQLAVTVAGNLAVLPLTGVTFPFVSFGMTSLCVNMAFLALCLQMTVPERGAA